MFMYFVSMEWKLLAESSQTTDLLLLTHRVKSRKKKREKNVIFINKLKCSG